MAMNDYDRVARVIRFLDEQHTAQPDLVTLARQAGLSPYHFHRLFSRWAGVTPKDFLQCLTHSHAKRLLRRGESVLTSALDVGLSGPGRLHDLCVTLDAASPGELKSGGSGWTITVGFAGTPFGDCLIGKSPRGICHLSFVEARDLPAAEAAIREDWPLASIHWDDAAASILAGSIFHSLTDEPSQKALRAFVRGTTFQVKVWRALLEIPRGSLVSYSQVAEKVSRRQSARAVGTAVAANRLAYLIPCHRVIRETGVFGEYRWGAQRKRAIVAWEESLWKSSRLD